MDDGRIPQDILYGELATGTRPIRRPNLRFKDVCKRDLKAGNINLAVWEALAADRSHWRLAVKAATQACEERREEQWNERRERRRLRAASVSTEPSTEFFCNNCNQTCRSRIGLYSYSRRCNSTTDQNMALIPLSPETDGCQQCQIRNLLVIADDFCKCVKYSLCYRFCGISCFQGRFIFLNCAKLAFLSPY